MSGHTKSPWTLQDHEHEPCELIGNGTIHIADIYMTDFPAGKADAQLIAAAPDLLAACHEALCVVPEGGEVERRILYAINKAERGSHD